MTRGSSSAGEPTSAYAELAAKHGLVQQGVRGPFGAGVGQDDKDPNNYAVSLYQGGLGMPDRDYYLSTDAKLVQAKAAYQAHIAKMLTLAGEANAEARAKALVDFETQIAQASWTRIESRDATKTYNKITVAHLQQQAPGFDFATWLKDAQMPVDSVIVAQPSAVTGIAKLVAAAPIQILQDQLLVRSLDRPGLLGDVSGVLAAHKVNIIACTMKTDRDRMALMKFDCELGDPSHLDAVLGNIRRIDGVYGSYRVLPGAGSSD